MQTQKRHVTAYDMIRIIAAFLVVLGHSTYLTITTDFGGIDWKLPTGVSPVYNSVFFSGLRYLSAWVYRFHIPLFFMLSGSVYFLGQQYAFKELVFKKLRRLVVPFILCGLLFMIPLKTIGGYYSVQDYFKVNTAFLSGKEMGHLWFLTSLFWCFIVFYGLKALLRSALPVFAATLLLYLFHDRVAFHFFEFSFSMQYVLFFAAGYYFNKTEPFFEKSRYGAALCFLGLLILNIADTRLHFLPPVFFIFAGCGLVYSFAFALCRPAFAVADSAVFKKLVRHTMNIYLFHDPLMYLILYFFIKEDLLVFSWGCGAYFFLRTAGVIIFSVFIGEVLEKTISFLQRKIHEKSTVDH